MLNTIKRALNAQTQNIHLTQAEIEIITRWKTQQSEDEIHGDFNVSLYLKIKETRNENRG
jgi:hypothetical protein